MIRKYDVSVFTFLELPWNTPGHKAEPLSYLPCPGPRYTHYPGGNGVLPLQATEKITASYQTELSKTKHHKTHVIGRLKATKQQ